MGNIIKLFLDKILLIVIAFVITVIFTMFMISNELGAVKVGAITLLILMLIIFGITLAVEKPLQRNYYLSGKYRYHAELVPEVLHSMFEDCSHDGSQGFLESEIKDMHIIRDGELYDSYNYIVGRSSGVAFSVAEVRVGDFRNSLTVSEDYFFKGLVFDFDYPYCGDGRLDIIGRNYRFCPVKLPEYENENPVWKELALYATIHTDEPAMVTDYFSSKWISFLITIEEEHHNMVLFSIQNGHFYMVIPDKLTLFEMQTPYGVKIDVEREKNGIRKELAIITDVVSSFSLCKQIDWDAARVNVRRTACEKDYIQLLKSMKPRSMVWVVMGIIFLFLFFYIFAFSFLFIFRV